MRYHFFFFCFGFLIRRGFLFTFLQNCGFSLLLLLLQIGVLSFFSFSFRWVSIVHDGGMDGCIDGWVRYRYSILESVGVFCFCIANVVGLVSLRRKPSFFPTLSFLPTSLFSLP